MSLFSTLFGSSRPSSELSTAELVRRIERFLKVFRNSRRGDVKRAKLDILELGNRPFSEAAFELIRSEAPRGPLYKEARHALGTMGHPKSAAVLVAMLKNRNEGGSRNDLIPILGQAKNASAIPELLKVALEDRDYFVVEMMVKVLERMSVAAASDALRHFRAQPSRRLSAVYFESPEPIYTSRLGQVPGEEELAAVLPEMKTWSGTYRDYAFATDAYVQSMVDHLMEEPSESKAHGLEAYLQETRESLSKRWLTGSVDDPRASAQLELLYYPSIASDLSVKMLVKRAADTLPARQKMLREMLTPERRARIEVAIQRRLVIGRLPADLLKHGEPRDIEEYALRCLEGRERGGGWDLRDLRGYLQQAHSDANAAELLRLLQQGNKSELEAQLLTNGSNSAIFVLNELGCSRLWERLLESEIEYWHGGGDRMRDATTLLCARFPAELTRALGDLLMSGPVLSPVVPVLACCGVFGTPTLHLWLERLRALLFDSTWATRRDALSFLLRIQRNEEADHLLRTYLAWEQDFELQTLAKRFGESDKTVLTRE